MKSYEKELPEGYAAAKIIDAKDKKIGIVFNLLALLIMLPLIAVALIPFFTGAVEMEYDFKIYMLTLVGFMLSLVLYMVLHELLHGLGYKLTTGEKLTFGISWSCAFCGVPSVYCYRRTALISTMLPLVVFSFVLIPLNVLCYYFAHPMIYIFSAILTSIHLGGCVGDIYVMLLLLFKFKDKTTLVNDTGPKQTFYVKSGAGSASL